MVKTVVNYMSHEYANGGLFLVKSDAFSFGVMTLELKGKRKAYISIGQITPKT